MVFFVYDDGGRKAAAYKGREELRDCVTRAIAIAADLPYREVYFALSKGNAAQRLSKRERQSKNRTGVMTASHGIYTKRKWFKDYMNSLGFIWTPTMKVGSGCQVHLREDELPAEGRLVLKLSKHCAAYIDGTLRDTDNCSRDGTRCVYGYWTKQ
tara:strand:- start:400 stop:864 length:465 start_codon:yes stop_codon:yes gene_type:complete